MANIVLIVLSLLRTVGLASLLAGVAVIVAVISGGLVIDEPIEYWLLPILSLGFITVGLVFLSVGPSKEGPERASQKKPRELPAPVSFLLGSDLVGDLRTYYAVIRRYNALLKQLTPQTRVKVANANFLRVMPKQGASLPADYVYPEERFTRYEGPLEEPPNGPGNNLQELLQENDE